MDASEVTRSDFPKCSAGVLALSQSGETKDVHRALVLAQEEDVTAFSIVNTVRSLIARLTNCGIYVHAGRENGVASTKSFTSQVLCLCLVGIWFAQTRPGVGGLLLRMCTHAHIHSRSHTCICTLTLSLTSTRSLTLIHSYGHTFVCIFQFTLPSLLPTP